MAVPFSGVSQTIAISRRVGHTVVSIVLAAVCDTRLLALVPVDLAWEQLVSGRPWVSYG